MIKLTKTAWKVYLAFLSLNLLMMAAALQVHSYYLKNRNIPIPPNTVRNVVMLVSKLQKHSKEEWPHILQKFSLPATISLSTDPMYGSHAFLVINPMLVFDLFKQNQRLEISVFINKDTWLNVKISPLLDFKPRLFIGLAVLILVIYVIVSFLLIKNLSQPIETIIQSLEDNELQENWMPIPLTGNIDQKNILKKINRLQKKVHKLLWNRTQVVAAISHDLRTPLTRLKLRAENLVENKNSVKIMNDIHEMEMMIRDTLNYFKDIHHTEQPQRFDLIALLSSLKEDTQDAGQTVFFSTPIQKLVYIGAVNLLKRAIVNIVNNAIYHGGYAVITLKEIKKTIYLTISDQGPGVPEDELERIFNPFYRTEQSRSRKTGGTGLGLTIAKEIIEMHHGTISIANHKDGGLEVNIQLPLAKPG
ncbi:MAG: sensor histidine kinase [Legionella sp.]|nr:sensor histidine kinase [Legionella sp.]